MDCDGSPEQRWEFVSDGTIRTVGLCMDVAAANPADRTTIQLAICNGNQAQQFRLQNRMLVSQLADKCLDIYNALTANGSRVVLYPCHGGGNQRWTYTS